MTHHATPDELAGWFAGRLPDDWFAGAPDVSIDREEILVVGEIADVDLGPDATDAARAAARTSRVERFRDETRGERMAIAEDAQHRFRRIVSWGVRIAGEAHHFTTASVPVMTRLRQPERRVLDTLVEAGVARSRSDALAWCVKLVGENEVDLDRQPPRRAPRRRGCPPGRPERRVTSGRRRHQARPTAGWERRGCDRPLGSSCRTPSGSRPRSSRSCRRPSR